MHENKDSENIEMWWTKLGSFFLWTILFSTAYTQAPLYFSNQHQYFLHGLADGGWGYLNEDWLANSADPTPIFSALVSFTFRYLSESVFYVYYALLMGVYFASLLHIFSSLTEGKASRTTRMVFIALFFMIHSALLRCISARLFGVDYPWYFQAGVAGQYVLGPMFQPSTFGVLLIASLCFAGRKQYFCAVTCSSLGAVAHTTYLLPAAMLTLSYMIALMLERRALRAFLVGGLALAIVLPVVIYTWILFRPSSMEVFTEAKRILVNFRIPHHTIITIWCDPVAVTQVLWMILGILLARRTPFFLPLVVSFTLSGLLTIVQFATGNNALALLFPWRSSVILMPVATTTILTRIVSWGAERSQQVSVRRNQAVIMLCWAIIIVLVVGGLIIMSFRLAFQTRDEETAMLSYVRESKSSGNVYLLPIPVPNLKKHLSQLGKGGSRKSDFIPVREVQRNPQFIKVNLQRFRLYTGAAIYVDFKSIPYRGEDVLEWRERLETNESLYEELKQNRHSPEKLETTARKLIECGISHVVLPAREELVSNPSLTLVFPEDEYFRVYRVRPLKK